MLFAGLYADGADHDSWNRCGSRDHSEDCVELSLGQILKCGEGRLRCSRWPTPDRAAAN